MTDKVLLDTNLWVYFYAKNPVDKAQIVTEIISSNTHEILMSTQVLGELFHVLTRKKFTTTSEAIEIIEELIDTFSVLTIDTSKVSLALQVHQEYRYSYWDSLIVATALMGECAVLYSEDMHHSQQIEDKLSIINPFTPRK
jgi:predicted nucleic acid-binding protein